MTLKLSKLSFFPKFPLPHRGVLVDRLRLRDEARFDVTDQKIDDRFDILGAKIDALIRVTWWIMGLIGAGLIIPLLTLIIHQILKL